MRKFVLTAVMLASMLTPGVSAPAAAAPTGHDALASIRAQTAAIETVQAGEYRRQQRFRQRQAARRREFRRRQAARAAQRRGTRGY